MENRENIKQNAQKFFWRQGLKTRYKHIRSKSPRHFLLPIGGGNITFEKSLNKKPYD
jgi:hypothetical protein